MKLKIKAVLVALLLVNIAAMAEQKCSHPEENVVEEEICADKALLKGDEEVTHAFEQLKSKLSGENQSLLQETQGYFYRERNDCQNTEKSKIPTCLKHVLESRRELLNQIAKDPTQTKSLITAIQFADPGFFQKYSNELVGKELQIFGALVLYDPKKNAKSRLKGAIFEHGETDKVHVPVIFKSMTESDAAFLTQQKPSAHHRGLVKKVGNQVVFYLSHVMGKALP